MTNDGWGSKWPDNWKTSPSEPIKVIEQVWPLPPRKGWPKNDPENIIEEYSGTTPEMLGVKPDAPALTGLDLAIGERTVLTKFEDGEIKHRIIKQAELKRQGSNLVDDQAYLYFQCDDCNTILDPHTKSFKTLQDKRVEAGWKVKWNLSGMGYKVYCEKCGDKS